MKSLPSDRIAGRSRLVADSKLEDAEGIHAYLPMVRYIAEKIHRRLPPGVDLESLIHSGVVGLLEALERFDPKRGVEFEVYARYRIQGEVMQCLRSLDWVSRSVRSWGRKIDAARAKLSGQLAREPSSEEIAKELKIPIDSYYRFDQQVSDAALLSIEDLAVSAGGDWEKNQERFTENGFVDPLRLVEDKDLVEKLTAALQELPERERLVMTLYYHEELTLREIGEIVELSEGRICQIFSQAVARLRAALGVEARAKQPTAGKRALERKSERKTAPA